MSPGKRPQPFLQRLSRMWPDVLTTAPSREQRARRAGVFAKQQPQGRSSRRWRALVLDGTARLAYLMCRRGCISMVEKQLPKLMTRVRFPSPAPLPPLSRY